MVLKNSEIYDLAIKSQVFYKDKINQFPVKIGFYLFKNLKILKQAAIEIEEMRQNILEPFKDEQVDDETFKVDKKLQEQAQKRLNSLSNLEQDLPLYTLNLDDFGDTKLTSEQLEVLIEMIEEKEEED